MMSKRYPDILRQANSSRIKHAYNALVEIRKTFIKSDKGVETLVSGGLVERLLELLQTWGSLEESYKVKVTDICVSILGNMCMAEVTRKEVLRIHGINVIVHLLLECDIESILNRGCRCLANILLSPGSWKLVHDTPVVERLVKLLDETDNDECKQTYIRAIRLLGQTSKHVQILLDKRCVSVVTKTIDEDQEAVYQSALRCLLSLSNHCCNVDFASQLVSSGKLDLLLAFSKNKNTDALQLMVRLCNLPNFRPDFGNANGIDIFARFFRSDDEFLVPFKKDCLDVLTLCCKDAVNRVKLRESGCLQIFVNTLSNDTYSLLHGRIISALVCFLYDQTSFDVLLENGLVEVLVSHLRQYMAVSDQTDGFLVHKPNDEVEHDQCQQTSEVRGNTLLNKSDTNDKGSSESNIHRGGKKSCGNIDSSLTKQTVTNVTTLVEADQYPLYAEDKLICDDIKSGDLQSIEELNDTLTGLSSVQRQRPIYSIDSPTYQPVFEWNANEYNKGVKCKERFTPPHHTEFGTPTKVYSPLSNSSYYSPSEGSPQYFSPGTSPKGSRFRSRSSSPVDSSRASYQNTYTGITSMTGYSPNTSPKSVLSESAYNIDCLSECDRTSPVSNLLQEDSTSDLRINISNIPHTSELDEKNDADRQADSDSSPEFIKPEYRLSVIAKAQDKFITRKRKSVSIDSIVFENNILILLSRISQTTNPTNYLVTMQTMWTLIHYLCCMESPLARAARLLSRVFRNPLCFEAVLRLNIPTVIYEYLLCEEKIQSLLLTVIRNRKSFKRHYSTSKYEVSSDEAADSDRFSLTCDTSSDDLSHPAKRRRGYSSEDTRHQFKGTYHKQEESVCDVGRSGVAFLEDLSEVADSSYGRGVVEKILCENNGAPNVELCTALLFVTWSAGSRIFYCKQLTVLDQVLTLLQDPQHRHSDQSHTAIMALSVVLQAMDTRSKYQKKTAGNEFICSWINRNIKASSQDVFTEGSDNSAQVCQIDASSSHDLRFIVAEETIFATRKCLSKSSEIFTAMLDGYYSEAKQSTITIPNTSKEAFKFIIHHLHGCIREHCKVICSIYTAEVTRKSTQTLIDILTESDKYLLTSLKDELIDLLHSHYIVPHSALFVLKFSVLYGYQMLQNSAISAVMVDCDSVENLLKYVDEILCSNYCTLFLQTLEDMIVVE